MFAARLRSCPGPPARNFVSSVDASKRRGVWHSAQCDAPPARYSPRASPPLGATFGAATMVRVGTGIFSERGGTTDLTGLTDLRYATSAAISSSAMLLRYLYGWIGNSRDPSGRSPRRIASTTCASVHFPIPVSASGVMLGV